MKNSLLVPMLAVLFAPAPGRAADDLTLWNEFRQAVHEGRITGDRVRPYYEHLREPLVHQITTIYAQSKPAEWEAPPEIHRVGNQVHFLIRLTAGGAKTATYCFSIVEDGKTWFLQHLEAIFIRLDRVGSLPASKFPDVSEGTKTWMRQEIAMTERVRLFNLLAKEKGKPFAVRWFNDGAGYFLAARTWVPFVTPARAFVLYLCWEQSNLRGNPVTLESLGDNQAVVRLDSADWRLYQRTGHLSQMISMEDYRALFESIWQDRAAAAGWKLRIECEGSNCLLRLDRPPAPSARP